MGDFQSASIPHSPNQVPPADSGLTLADFSLVDPAKVLILQGELVLLRNYTTFDKFISG